MDFEMIGTIAKKHSALRTLLAQFDVPEIRRETTRKANLLWLNRNLAINNGEHAMLETAMDLVKWLLKNHPEGH